MPIIVNQITLITLIFLIKLYFKNYKNIIFTVYIVDIKKSKNIYLLLLSFFNLKYEQLKWNYFDLKDKKNKILGLKVEGEISNYLLNLIVKKKLSQNNIDYEKNNYHIFLVKHLLHNPWFYSDRTLLQHITIIYAINDLLLKTKSKQCIYFLENFPFREILDSLNPNSTIKIVNQNFYLNILFVKKFFNSLFYLKIKKFKLWKNNLNLNNNLFTKINNLYKNMIIFDNDMLLHDPKIFHKNNILSIDKFIYTTEHWYLDKDRIKFTNKKNFKIIPIKIFPGNIKNSIFSFSSIKNQFKLKANKKNYLNMNENLFNRLNLKDYFLYKNGWHEFFRSNNAKIFFTVNKFSSSQIAASSAIRECLGVSTVMQSSFYEYPWSQGILDYDVFFSFSNYFSKLEKNTGSNLKQQVAVGYTNDYKFKIINKNIINLRNKLKSNGAKKIIAFFDQGSTNDIRWSLSDEKSLLNYSFLLQKVIDCDWIGLIIKPKKPGIINDKLSKIANLYNKAISTGRCQMIGSDGTEHIKNFNDIPAHIAMSSDISIHDTMVAGTAGFESALTNTPTFFLDSYNFSDSIFYNNVNGKIVYNSWNELWPNVVNFLQTNKSFNDLHWKNIIDKLDPYQDGNSNLRIENYLSYLQKGFELDYTADESLNFAAEQFTNKWGNDKIIYFK